VPVPVGLADVVVLVVVVDALEVVDTLVEVVEVPTFVELLLALVLVEDEDEEETPVPVVNVDPMSPHLMFEKVT